MFFSFRKAVSNRAAISARSTRPRKIAPRGLRVADFGNEIIFVDFCFLPDLPSQRRSVGVFRGRRFANRIRI
jgi:hypothetical protein